jgi:CheY-like chemotaxis protein
MNGIESIKSLRAALGWNVPAIVMTGDTRSSTMEATAAYGVSVLIKPFSADQLVQLSNRLCPSSATNYGSEYRRTRCT